MHLQRFAGQGFRNLAPFELETPERFVVLVGDNAQGKTNALEAIYLLATLKPLRGHRHRALIAWGAQAATVTGTCSGDFDRRYRVDLAPGERTARLDGERVVLTDYFEGIRAISFTPADTAIVASEPARRRRWLDRAAFTAAPAHLDVARDYRRCLSQKSAALREGADTTQLDALDDQLAQLGGRLATRRDAMLRQLEPHVQAAYQQLARTGRGLTLRYRTAARGESEVDRIASLRDALAQARAGELRRRMTLVGPQTDEVVVALDGQAVRTYGSQGQVRSVVLALKLAEMAAGRARGQVPIFLLDDVGSELDGGRTARLVEQLDALGAQVFATTTNARHLQDLPAGETKFVIVESGVLSSS